MAKTPFMMNRASNLSKNLLLLAFISLSLLASAQGPVLPKPAVKDSTVKKPGKADYSHLLSEPESDTKVFGKVINYNTQLFPKGELFGDSFSYINKDAVVELLNTELPLNRAAHRMLVKVISNPPKEEAVGKIGWMLVDHTTLLQYLDEENRRIDTNIVRSKYLKGAAKLRDEAKTTTCAENKKCNLAWAAYYECMAKAPHFDVTPSCKLADCAVQDCPGDKK
jgi:hypothetical protein